MDEWSLDFLPRYGKILDEFYSKHAENILAEKMDNHSSDDAADDPSTWHYLRHAIWKGDG